MRIVARRDAIEDHIVTPCTYSGWSMLAWSQPRATGSPPRCTELSDGNSAGRGPINDMAWSPAGDELAVADDAGNVTVYAFPPAGGDGGGAIDPRAGRVRAHFRPFDGAPVQSVLLAAPGGGGKGGQATVVIVGSTGNRTLKMFDHAGARCLYTFRFEAPAPEAFLGILSLDPLSDFLIVANTVANPSSAHGGQPAAGSVYALHLRHAGADTESGFDCLSEFSVVYPVLSCSLRRDPAPGEAEALAATGGIELRAAREMQLYCLQTKAIQQYHLPPAHCYDIGPLPLPDSVVPISLGAPPGFLSAAAGAAEPLLRPASAGGDKPASLAANGADATAAPVIAPTTADEPSAAVKRFLQEAALSSASPPVTLAPAPAAVAPPSVVTPQEPVPAEIQPAAAGSVGGGAAAVPAAGGQGGGVALDAAVLEAVVSKAVEAALAQSQAAMAAKVEAEAAKRRAKDKEEQKRSTEAVAARVAAAVEERMGKLEERLCAAVAEAAQREARAALATALPAALETYFKSPAHLEQSRAVLAPAVAAGVANKVEQAVKATGEKTAQGVCAGIRPLLNESFTAGFEMKIVPAFERSCQIMFDQMTAAFDRGLTQPAEGLAALETGTRRLQGQFDQLQTLVGQTSEAQQRLQQGVDAQLKLQRQHLQLLERAQTSAAVAPPSTPTPASAPHIAAATTAGLAGRPLPGAVPDHIGAGGVVPAAVEPASPAAAPGRAQRETEELAMQLTGLLRQERYEEAFSQVLSLSDLQLVTWLCRSVNPGRLFGAAAGAAGRRPPLSSPVVLSLVQQLGFDLTTDTRLKVEWLREATQQLDRRDPLVSTHIPNIVRDLHLKLLAMERAREQGPAAAMASGADAVSPADVRTLLQTCSKLL